MMMLYSTSIPCILINVFTPNPKDGTLDVTLSTIDNCPIYYTLDGSEPTAASAQYAEPLKLKRKLYFPSCGSSSYRKQSHSERGYSFQQGKHEACYYVATQ